VRPRETMPREAMFSSRAGVMLLGPKDRVRVLFARTRGAISPVEAVVAGQRRSDKSKGNERRHEAQRGGRGRRGKWMTAPRPLLLYIVGVVHRTAHPAKYNAIFALAFSGSRQGHRRPFLCHSTIAVTPPLHKIAFMIIYITPC